jgi:hypothetical protein
MVLFIKILLKLVTIDIYVVKYLFSEIQISDINMEFSMEIGYWNNGIYMYILIKKKHLHCTISK